MSEQFNTRYRLTNGITIWPMYFWSVSSTGRPMWIFVQTSIGKGFQLSCFGSFKNYVDQKRWVSWSTNCHFCHCLENRNIKNRRWSKMVEVLSMQFLNDLYSLIVVELFHHLLLFLYFLGVHTFFQGTINLTPNLTLTQLCSKQIVLAKYKFSNTTSSNTLGTLNYM